MNHTMRQHPFDTLENNEKVNAGSAATTYFLRNDLWRHELPRRIFAELAKGCLSKKVHVRFGSVKNFDLETCGRLFSLLSYEGEKVIQKIICCVLRSRSANYLTTRKKKKKTWWWLSSQCPNWIPSVSFFLFFSAFKSLFWLILRPMHSTGRLKNSSSKETVFRHCLDSLGE